MRVLALVGKSGTGKSYQCNELAREYGIDGIIDDGILISGNRILAGKSAKHETNKMASVKCAIFENEDHALQVREAIKANGLESVLVLGTSDRMVKLIASRLGLPEPEKIIYIEDVATPEEIQIASDMRTKQGKHIIPVPVPEVKKQFSGYFLKSLIIPGKKGQSSEDTVIRPTYSYLGKFRIAPRVISDICRFELSKVPEISHIYKVNIDTDANGYLTVTLEIALGFPCDIPATSRRIQNILGDAIEYSTSLIANNIIINVKSLSV